MILMSELVNQKLKKLMQQKELVQEVLKQVNMIECPPVMKGKLVYVKSSSSILDRQRFSRNSTGTLLRKSDTFI